MNFAAVCTRAGCEVLSIVFSKVICYSLGWQSSLWVTDVTVLSSFPAF